MSSSVCLTNLLGLSDCDTVISEHKLSESCSNFFSCIDNNYISTAKFEKSNRSDEIGKGGVAISYKKSLEFYTSSVYTNSNRVVGICLKTPNHVPLFVFGVYMPSENDTDQCREVLNVLNELFTNYSNHGHVIFAGDINASILETDADKTNPCKSAELTDFL
jgi:exonuclease III